MTNNSQNRKTLLQFLLRSSLIRDAVILGSLGVATVGVICHMHGKEQTPSQKEPTIAERLRTWNDYEVVGECRNYGGLSDSMQGLVNSLGQSQELSARDRERLAHTSYQQFSVRGFRNQYWDNNLVNGIKVIVEGTPDKEVTSRSNPRLLFNLTFYDRRDQSQTTVLDSLVLETYTDFTEHTYSLDFGLGRMSGNPNQDLITQAHRTYADLTSKLKSPREDGTIPNCD